MVNLTRGPASVLKHTRDALGVVASSQSSWSRWLGCRLPCRSILDLGRPPSEADHRSQSPKLTALYPNSLSSLWIRLRRDPFEARPLTERDPMDRLRLGVAVVGLAMLLAGCAS